MIGNRWMMFGAGIVLGAVAPRCLMEQPAGRQALKSAIKGGYAVYDWVTSQVEKVREDVTDLVAEAVTERGQASFSASSKVQQAATASSEHEGE